jgi:hypothetical protein
MILYKHYFTLSKKYIIPAGASQYLSFKTNGFDAHFEEINMDNDLGGIEGRFLKSMVFSGGSLIYANNLNDGEGVPHTVVIKESPTVSSDGTELRLFASPLSTSPSVKSVSANKASERWQLKGDTNYGFKFTNISGVSITSYISLSWAEYELL